MSQSKLALTRWARHIADVGVERAAKDFAKAAPKERGFIEQSVKTVRKARPEVQEHQLKGTMRDIFRSDPGGTASGKATASAGFKGHANLEKALKKRKAPKSTPPPKDPVPPKEAPKAPEPEVKKKTETPQPPKDDPKPRGAEDPVADVDKTTSEAARDQRSSLERGIQANPLTAAGGLVLADAMTRRRRD